MALLRDGCIKDWVQRIVPDSERYSGEEEEEEEIEGGRGGSNHSQGSPNSDGSRSHRGSNGIEGLNAMGPEDDDSCNFKKYPYGGNPRWLYQVLVYLILGQFRAMRRTGFLTRLSTIEIHLEGYATRIWDVASELAPQPGDSEVLLRRKGEVRRRREEIGIDK